MDKPKYCKSLNDTCKCEKRASYAMTKKSTEKLEFLINIMKNPKLPKKSRYYKTLLKDVRKLKGDWFVNSPRHDFCFWNYLAEVGSETHTLFEIAELLDLSISAIATIERKALEKLKEHYTDKQAFDL